ncbi:hypothetical protein PT974_01377 [Cladobotryum mycophilum]|uniref:Phosphoribosyltransferase domain-containing protein n=1 Tax=Cladobotryum mycophilum TaxID=491253 RepID=A0ABR0T3S6_9HYPO
MPSFSVPVLPHTGLIVPPTEKLPDKKPVIIGLYGLPGCGKSFLLNQLKGELGHDDFQFYEGSEMIASLVPGGLEAFKALPEPEKYEWRQLAIDAIKQESVSRDKTAVVTGHFMFWNEDQAAGTPVCTQKDLSIYTHIIYLGTSAECIAQRSQEDTLRNRTRLSIETLKAWQSAEIRDLRHLCCQHQILFLILNEQDALLSRVSAMIRHFHEASYKNNWFHVEKQLDEIIREDRGSLETVLLLDGDKTLSPEDTGEVFWTLGNPPLQTARSTPANEIFKLLGYSEFAFRQVTLLHEEAASDQEYEERCKAVASACNIHLELLNLLKLLSMQKLVTPIVITSGLGRIWEMMLAHVDLSKTVKVIGGGRVSDNFIVTPEVKAEVVKRLRNAHGLHVWAFGDSPLDLPMLKAANEAYVVVGDARTRSRSMEGALAKAIEDGLEAKQVLLPKDVSPRLDEERLPHVVLESDFYDSLTSTREERHMLQQLCNDQIFQLQILHATNKNASKLLRAPTRDGSLFGPTLRRAHHEVGRYLATEFVSEVVGVKEFPLRDVQGHMSSAYRLCGEETSCIVALMRAGEPMALGVSGVFPTAMFLHAKETSDILTRHIEHRTTILLVDSVINTGKTIIEFVEHICSLDANVRIVVVAGVVQADTIQQGHPMATLLNRRRIPLVALRISSNKYKGVKNLDTGNRLFNTTHLD